MRKILFVLICLFTCALTVNALESRYSLVDEGFNTPVRDQGDTNTCWAFATTESIMSNMSKNHLTLKTFSPSHIDILTQDTYRIDRFKTFKRSINTGGNFDISAAYVMNGWGPVLESKAPYNDYLTFVNNNTGLNVNSYKDIADEVSVYDIAIVNNSKGACTNNAITEMKNYLKNYGAIASLVNWADTSLYLGIDDDGNYFLTGEYTNREYYYTESNDDPNHAITIVGWDDSISPDKYMEGHRPTRSGAWIVKNSWGPSKEFIFTEDFSISAMRGDNGYYYIPYDDVNICRYWAGFHNVKDTTSDYNYFYDYLGSNNGLIQTASTTSYMANQFTKQGNENEHIDRITFFSLVSGIPYEVYYSSTGDLNSYKKIAEGTIEYTGYTSVVPNEEIVIGSDYGVIVKFNFGNGTKQIPIATATNSSNGHYQTYTLDGTKSFISYDGASWQNLSSFKGAVPVRVYTSDTVQEETPSVGETTTTPVAGAEPTINENNIVETSTNTNNTEVIEEEITPTDTVTEINPGIVIPKNNTTAKETATEEVKEGEVENPKTGSSISATIIVIGLFISLSLLIYRKRYMYKI